MAPCKKLKLNGWVSSTNGLDAATISQDGGEEPPVAESPNLQRRRSARLRLLAKSRSNLELRLSQQPDDFLGELSLEIICRVLDYLPLRDVLKMECLSKKIKQAVDLHLRLRRAIDFTEGIIYGWMPDKIHDSTLAHLMSRCSELEYIYGFHPHYIGQRRQRGVNILSIPGVIHALTSAPKLKGIEISDIFLLEAILKYLPKLEILGTFKNRECYFPIFSNNKLSLLSNPVITSLHLTGVVIPELPRMQTLKHLYLRFVRLTLQQPFRDFAAPSLRTFVMAHCAGPINPLRHVPLITSLAMAKSLQRLDLLRVPFLGGLIQHIVDDSWRVQGFRNLQAITFGACKHALEVDLGFLIITCAAKLTELCVQPSLTKDNLFAALTMAEVTFPKFKSLTLGFVDSFPEPGKWTADELITEGLVEVQENPAMITDIGMKAAGRVFPTVSHMEIYNCPHLHYPCSWFYPEANSWSNLEDLHLRRCHAIRLEDLNRFIPMLPSLVSLHLEFMLREPPKGCARVGLSAGTGLGVSSALVQNNGADAHNQPNAAAAAANNHGGGAAAAPPPAAQPAAAAAAAPPPPPPYPPPPQPPPPAAGPGPQHHNQPAQAPPPPPPEPEQLPPPPTPPPPPPPPIPPVDILVAKDNNEAPPSARAIAVTANRSDYHPVSAAEQSPGSSRQSPENSRQSPENSRFEALKSSPDSDDGLGSVDSSSSSEEDEEGMIPVPDRLRDCVSTPQEESVQPGPSGIHNQCPPNHSCVSTSPLSSSQSSADANRDEEGCVLNRGKVDADKKSSAAAKSKVTSTSASSSSAKPPPPTTTAGSGALSVQPSTSGLKKCSQHSAPPSTAAPDSTTTAASPPQGNHQDPAGETSRDDQTQDIKNNKNLANMAWRKSSGQNAATSSSSSSSSSASSSASSSSSESTNSSSGTSGNNNGRYSASASLSCTRSSDDSRPCNVLVARGNASSLSRSLCPSEPLPSTSTQKTLPTCDTHSDDDPGVDSECLSNGASHTTTNKTTSNTTNRESSNTDRRTGNCIQTEDSSSVLSPSHSTTNKTTSSTNRATSKTDRTTDNSIHTENSSSEPSPSSSHSTTNKSTSNTNKTTSSTNRASSSTNRTTGNSLHTEDSSLEPSPSGRNPVVGTCESEAADGSSSAPSCSSSSSSKGKCLRSGSRKNVKSVSKSKKICDSSSSSSTSTSSSVSPPTSSSSLPSSKSASSTSSSSASEVNCGEPTKVNQSCQAVSEEIRETTRKAKENEEAAAGKASASAAEGSSSNSNASGNSAESSSSSSGSRSASTGRGGSAAATATGGTGAGGASTSSVDSPASCAVSASSGVAGCRSAASTRSGPRYNNTRKAVKRKMNTCDQATSTSDPVHEEDHVQVLGVQSKTLTTLTLHMVGITDLYLSDCPNLTTISCSACRVLKKISISECPKLSRVSFAQCKKLLEDQVVKELSTLSSDVSRVLFLRPMHQMQIPVQSLFGDDGHSSYHCLVKDHCKQPSMMVLNRKRAEVLVDLLPNINKTLRRILKCQEDGDSQARCQKTIHHFEELNEDGSLLEVKTDIPWLQFFLQNYSEHGEKEFLPSTPMCEEFATIQLEAMAEDIVKDGLQGDFLADSVFLVYINMCDISGMPTPDLYV